MRPYSSPARAGVWLGLVLLASFLLAHRGIGASGAFAAVAGSLIDRVSDAPASFGPALADRIPSDIMLSGDWIVLQLLGVLVGGLASAAVARRLSWRQASPGGRRLVRALVGGVLMGVGARLAYGCTSGLALTGGAQLVTGAWVFIPIAFATAMIVTRLARVEV